jgi:AcrR family transcriptional regulator
MRALPGRSSRSNGGEPAPTRGNLQEAQRRRILRAAGELVAKRGYNAVTVELIVKRAKVSFKTFYAQFAGKEECFLELFDSTVAMVGEEIADALAAEPEAPWPQQVALALRTLFAAIVADPVLARACLVESLTAGPLLAARYEEMLRRVEPSLRRGRELSPLGAELPDTLEDALSGGVLWIPYQRLISGEVDRVEALLPEAIEFVLRPYLGEAEAGRWARWRPAPNSESGSAPPSSSSPSSAASSA